MEFPGTERHVRILDHVLQAYGRDDRFAAVILFGSLAAGNWDQWSDVDLDVITVDGMEVDAVEEGRRLADTLSPVGSSLVIADGPDACDVVLDSLEEISVRFHALATTSPNVVGHFVVLCGDVDKETVVGAATANKNERDIEGSPYLDRCIRSLVEADLCLRRDALWAAIDRLERSRRLLSAAYRQRLGEARVERSPREDVEPELSTMLERLLPSYNRRLIEQSLGAFLSTLMGPELVELNQAQRNIVACLQSRLTTPSTP